MGAKIKRAGLAAYCYIGVKKLHGADYKIISDRIEAGTFLLTAAATRSNIILRNGSYHHLFALIDKLEEAGFKIRREK